MNKSKNILVHIYIWAIYVGLNYTLAYFQDSTNLLLSDHIAKYIIVIPVFYINSEFILPRIFSRKKYILFVIIEIILSVFHTLLCFITYRYILPAITSYPKMDIQIGSLFPRMLWWYFTFSLYAFGYWYARESVRKQKQITELQRKNFINEFNFLKLQINPHFLHNTLNALFAQSMPLSEHLANNIMKLSSMMRYSLQSIEAEDGRVLLKDELQHLHNLIDIHQLRYNNKLHISFEQSGTSVHQMIPALSLIIAVENAFKYGDLKNPAYPVKIFLKTELDSILFTCMNKKKKNTNEISFGLGLSNLKKRLDYICSGNYSLILKNENEFFYFELTLKNTTI